MIRQIELREKKLKKAAKNSEIANIWPWSVFDDIENTVDDVLDEIESFRYSPLEQSGSVFQILLGKDTKALFERFTEMADIGVPHLPCGLADIGPGLIQKLHRLLHPIFPEIVKHTFSICLSESGLKFCRGHTCHF